MLSGLKTQRQQDRDKRSLQQHNTKGSDVPKQDGHIAADKKLYLAEKRNAFRL